MESPDGNTKSHIDHIMISTLIRTYELRARPTSVMAIKNFVIAKCRLKLRRAKIGTKKSKRFDFTKLT